MGIEKVRLLVCQSVYWLSMNADLDNTVRHCATCLGYQLTQPHEKTMPHELPSKPWKIVGADIFSIDNETLLCIADYYSKFLIMNWADKLSADDLIRAAKVMFCSI